MSESYRSRFSRLEIPDEMRQLDWSFLESSLSLPRPIPLEDQAILVWINGRALVPVDGGDAGSIHLYDLEHGLGELDPISALEAAWRTQHQTALARATKRFVDRAPTAIIQDPGSVQEALTALGNNALPDRDDLDADLALPARLGAVAPGCLFSRRIVGGGRFLRLHDKLFKLVTLREYTRIFERAIEPDMFRELIELPLRSTPANYLDAIEANRPAIHAAARSPLRNKMSTSRIVFDGITLLPIYIDQIGGIFATYLENLELDLKMSALGRV